MCLSAVAASDQGLRYLPVCRTEHPVTTTGQEQAHWQETTAGKSCGHRPHIHPRVSENNLRSVHFCASFVIHPYAPVQDGEVLELTFGKRRLIPSQPVEVARMSWSHFLLRMLLSVNNMKHSVCVSLPGAGRSSLIQHWLRVRTHTAGSGVISC